MLARLLPFLLLLTIIAVSYMAMMRGDVESRDILSWRIAPELMTKPLEGYQSPPLSSLNGRFVLVNFFASWCGPCEAEMEVLMKLPDEIIVYGVAWRDKPEMLSAWLDEMPKAYDYVAMDKDNETSIFYGSTGVPESFLISPEGEIVMHHAGPLTADIVNKTLLPVMNKVGM